MTSAGSALLLLLLFATVATIRITAPSDLASGDQSYELAYVRDIVQRGAWIVQHDEAGIPASKPPLFNWLAAAAVIAGGHNSELLIKLPSLAAALATLLVTVSVAAEVAGPRAALYAGVFLICSTMYAKHMYLARTDMLLTFFVAAQIWAALRNRPMTFGVFAALALLTKGPIGVILALASITAWWWWEGTLGRRLRAFRLVPVLLAATVPLLIWFAAARWNGGPEVWNEMVVRETVDRFAAGSKTKEHQNIAFYVPHLLWRMAPASFLAVAALASLRWRRGLESPPRIMLAAWWLVASFAVLSVIPSKRPDRLFTLLPALAILAGWAAERWFSAERPRPAGIAFALLCAVMAGGGVAALIMAAGNLPPVEPSLGGPAAVAGVLLILCGLILAISLVTRRSGVALTSVAAAMVVVIGFYQHVFSIPARAQSKSRRAATPKIAPPNALRYHSGRNGGSAESPGHAPFAGGSTAGAGSRSDGHPRSHQSSR